MKNELLILEQRAAEAKASIPANAMYFAHPVNYFEGSKMNMHGDTESRLISKITEQLPYSVYNPNQAHNQENYALWKKHVGSGMQYYYDVILPEMQAGIALPFNDGMIGAGTFGELEFLLNKGLPSYIITASGTITPITELDPARKLSVDETRQRVYQQ